MSKGKSDPAHLPSKVPGLKDRVQKKRQVLQEWLDDKIPYGKGLPASLNEVRLWKDSELGLYRIGSPNNFTSIHPTVGEDVTAIAAILTKLKAKIKRGRIKAHSAKKKPTISASEIEQALSVLVAQWHMAREEARKDRVRADNAERSRDIAREDCRQLREELAEIRRRMAVGLTVVK